MTTRPDLVIFDCDGVLVDSELPANEALAANLARHGLAMTVQDCMARFVGGTMRGVMAQAREMGADLPDDWLDEVYGETYARLEQGVDLVAGIPELLDALDAAAVPYCVASNGGPDKMKITLGQNGLWERFDGAMFSSHVLGVAKPDPTMFLTAARQFGVLPERCVVVEDSKSGATAAQRAGMRCLGYAPHGGGAALAKVGAEVMTTMYDVPGLIGLAGHL